MYIFACSARTGIIRKLLCGQCHPWRQTEGRSPSFLSPSPHPQGLPLKAWVQASGKGCQSLPRNAAVLHRLNAGSQGGQSRLATLLSTPPNGRERLVVLGMQERLCFKWRMPMNHQFHFVLSALRRHHFCPASHGAGGQSLLVGL